MRKRTGTFILVLLLSFSLSGCDAVYRLLQKEGAEEKDLVGEVLPFEPNATVKEIQKLLKLYGYSPGDLDGRLGINTRNSIEKFQKDNGLEQTRFVDQPTWERLNIFSASGLVSKNQINVFKLQEALQKAKLLSGKIDGKWGPKTKEAVKKFQTLNNLKADGRVGFKTLTLLNTFLTPQEPLETSPVKKQSLKSKERVYKK